MTKTKRFVLAMLFGVVTVFCFSALLFFNTSVKAEEAPQSYELVAGTSTDGLYAGTSQSSASSTAVGYSANLKALYINEFLNGKYAVIAFPEIDTAIYKYIDLLIYKNVNYGITLSIFKNDSSYSPTSVATNSYAFNNAGGVGFKGYVRVNLTELADANGKISSLIIRHETSNTQTEASGFQICILSAIVQPIVDYSLKIDGVDIVAGNAQGAEFVTPVVHTDTNKIFANGFSRGKAVCLKFGKAINIADYKTLELNLAFNGLSTPLDYYLTAYKYDTANVSAVEPDGRYHLADDPAINNKDSSKFIPHVLQIKLSDFADESGFVQGIILVHYSDSKADDFSNLSLYVFESKVLRAEAQSQIVKWQNALTGLEYNKNSDGKDKIVFTFAEKLTDSQVAVTVDNTFETEFLSHVLINDVALSVADVVSASVSGKDLTIIANSKIENLGKDIIKIEEASLTVSGFKYTLNKETFFEITEVISDGGKVSLVPVYFDYALKINGADIADGQKSQGANFIKLVPDVPKKLYANAFSRGSAVSIKFAKPIDSSIYKTLELRLCLFGLSEKLNYYIEGYRYGVSDISTESPSARFYIENDPVVNPKDVPFTVNVPLEAFADSDGFVRGIVLHHLFDSRLTDTNLLNLFVYESYVKKAVSEISQLKSWKTELDGVDYQKGFDANDKIILHFNTPMFEGSDTVLSVDDAFVSDFLSCLSINGAKIKKADVLSAVGAYNGNANSLALTIKSYINNDANDVVQLKAGAKFTVKYENQTETEFFTKENSEYIFTRVLNAGETLSLGVYSYVMNVGAKYSADNTVIGIEFNIAVGDISGYAPLNNIYIDDVKLSSYAQIDCAISADAPNVLNVTIPNSLDILKADGSSFLTIKRGLATEKVYVTEDSVYDQMDAGSAYWFIRTQEPVYVLWVENFNLDNVYGSFSIKLSAEYTGADVVGFDIVTFNKIKINGKTLSDILKEDDGAQVVLSGAYLNVYISAKGYSHCFTLSDTDRITIEKGFAVPYSGAVNANSEFVYDPLWEEFAHVKDLSDIEGKIIDVNVEAVETDKAGKDLTSLMVTFSEPIAYRFFPYAHRHVADLADIMKGFATSNPSDIYLSQMSKYGMLDSVLTNIVYDGKTLREWIEYDKRTSTEWRNSVEVRFLGPSLGFEDRIQIFFYSNSSALMDAQKTHTLEIKEGFLTPNLQRLDKSVTYSWDVLNERWVGINSLKEQTPEENDEGCKSFAFSDTILPLVVSIAIASTFVAVRKIKEG